MEGGGRGSIVTLTRQLSGQTTGNEEHLQPFNHFLDLQILEQNTERIVVLWHDTVQSGTCTPTLQRNTLAQKSVMLRRCLSVRLHKAYRVDGHSTYLRNYQTTRYPSTEGHIKNLHHRENLRSHIQHKYGTVYRVAQKSLDTR